MSAGFIAVSAAKMSAVVVKSLRYSSGALDYIGIYKYIQGCLARKIRTRGSQYVYYGR